MSFAEFKKAFKSSEAAKKMSQKIKIPGGDSYNDERFWKLTVDSEGNGAAIIRFLSQKDWENKPPFIPVCHHFFKEGGKIFSTDCPQTNGYEENCYACDFVQELWDKYNETKSEKDKTRALKYARKTSYITNIKVIKDPANPDNNGKVFLYKFGKKIYNKYDEMMNPVSEIDGDPKYPFHPIEGYDFKIKTSVVDGWQNYDNSKFLDVASPWADTEEELEEIFNQLYDLDEFLDKCRKVDNKEMEKRHRAMFKSGKKSSVADSKLPDNFSDKDLFAGDTDEKAPDEKAPDEKAETKIVDSKQEDTDKSKETKESKSKDTDIDDVNFDDIDFNFDDDIPF